MYFHYQNVGSTSLIRKKISLNKLALNVITDWIPGVPNSVARGFADLLSNVIESEKHNNSWTVQYSVTEFEKQWKQITSWLLAVAFCSRVAELEGYRW
jgi:hypothetical protein